MYTIRISVRDLVGFILRNGDIVSSGGGIADPDSMLEGTRIHKKLQHSMGSSYKAEVPLAVTLPVIRDGLELKMTIEGRADGIFPAEDGMMTIDEIKGIYQRLSRLREPAKLHLAQARCYGYIYARQHHCENIGIRITYCHIPTEKIRYFFEQISFKELEKWFLDLLQGYAKWVVWEIKWKENRNASIRSLSFPFDYREGQYKIVKGVYQSILRQKRLYIEAPTGVGKTISTIFPTVRSMGEDITEKIFYLTAKTITRTVAEETFQTLSQHGMKLKYITLTAREKICILGKPQCDPTACPRALGHFDRINDAVYDLLEHNDDISRDCILHYARQHNVCPFEMGLDTSIWCDAVIGDYNYAFDPTACLKRFFSQETKKDYVYLIDEAHNLVDRAREMYSAKVIKEDFMIIEKLIPDYADKLRHSLSACSHALLRLMRECDGAWQIYKPKEIEPFVIKAQRLNSLLEDFLHGKQDSFQDDPDLSDQSADPASLLDISSQPADPASLSDQSGQLPAPTLFPDQSGQLHVSMSDEAHEQILEFYFELRYFLTVYETLNDKYIIYADYNDTGFFQLRLQCIDPSDNLDTYLKKGRCAVFFSATLLPVNYYREQLAGRREDYAIYAPSPFSAKNRLLMIGTDVSTRYDRRGPDEYQRISDYVIRFVQAKRGNYLIFFPSYQMLEDIGKYIRASHFCQENADIFTQRTYMDEEEREGFLSHFREDPLRTTLGFCVMGGIFGEGIDLKNRRLIGAVIIGTGIPMISTQNELFREYFNKKKGTGFDYAYRYPGMNKVLQAAGRVIRTSTDRGAILLLDRRFLQSGYQELFPQEWYPYEVVNRKTMKKYLKNFWNSQE